MFKKKIKVFLVLVLTIFIIIICFFVLKKGVKYIDKIFASSQTKIATWSVNLNSINVQKLNIIDNTFVSSDVVELNTIAPGTKGEFNINIDFDNTDVGIKYKIIFKNETKKPENLKFIYEEKEYKTLKELEALLEGEIYTYDNIKQKVFNIKWVWNYETGETEEQIKENDKIDTQDAKNISNYCFDVEVEAHQIDPKEVNIKEGD